MMIGKRRYRVEIQSEIDSRDSLGGVNKNWAIMTKRWAAIEPMSAREYAQSSTTKADCTHKINIQFYKDLTPKMRIYHPQKKAHYNIFSITANASTLNWEQVVLVKEVLAGD